MKGLKLLIVFLSFVTISSSQGEVLIRTYYEDADVFPWQTKKGEGADFILFKMVEKKLKNEIKFSMEPVSWQRCLGAMKTDETDACFAASFKAERLANGVYPMSGDKADSKYKIHDGAYALYVRKEDEAMIKVDGLKVTGLASSDEIAVPKGYSVGDDLTNAGYKVDSSSQSSLNNFIKLKEGRVKAVAELRTSGEVLRSKDEFKDKVMAISNDLINKPYYIMFSHRFYGAHKEVVEKIWEAISEIRASKEFQKEVADYINSSGTN